MYAVIITMKTMNKNTSEKLRRRTCLHSVGNILWSRFRRFCIFYVTFPHFLLQRDLCVGIWDGRLKHVLFFTCARVYAPMKMGLCFILLLNSRRIENFMSLRSFVWQLQRAEDRKQAVFCRLSLVDYFGAQRQLRRMFIMCVRMPSTSPMISWNQFVSTSCGSWDMAHL